VVSKDYLSWQYLPSLRFISAYYHHPLYIAALAASVHEHRRQFPQADLLLMSFHGLPAKLTELGDPYFYHCQRTARLLANELGLGDDQWQMVFQSHFGKAKWLQPYCVQVLQDLPQQGIKNIDVICPGFAVDCLETLEEIAITNQEIFKAAGGGNYHYIPALNASESQVQLIIDLLKHKVDG
jgi:ferrochelatase